MTERCILSLLPPPELQAGDRATRKAARAEARGILRKVLKLLAGPLLESSPALLPRAAPLLLAALLVSQACGRKVAATAAKAARQLEHPLLAALQGLALPQEAEEGAQQQPAAAGKAKPSAKKGGKKAAGAAAAGEAKQQQQRAAAAAAQHKTAADAAYNAQVVTALAGAAAADPAAAAALTQLLAECSSSGEGSASSAEPLLLMTAHAAVQQGGQGSAAVAVSLLQHLQKQATAAEEQRQQWLQAGGASAVLPSECFETNGVPTGALLATFIAGQLSVPSLRATTVLAALRAVPWAALAPRGSKVRRRSLFKQPPFASPHSHCDTNRSCAFAAWPPPSTLPAPPPPSASAAGPAAAAAHALRAALAACSQHPLCAHGGAAAGRAAAPV